jgi:GNAT superfamily N-acetyltransferase
MPAHDGGRQAVDVACLPPGAIDYAAAARLISDAFRIHASMVGRDRIDIDGLRDEVGGNGRLLAIHEEGILAACAVVRPAPDVPRAYERPWLAHHPGALYYGLAGVDPARMGRRLGARLLHAAEDYARASGIREVVLSAQREMGNDAYYRRHGYSTESVLTSERNGATFHLHHMVKRV